MPTAYAQEFQASADFEYDSAKVMGGTPILLAADGRLLIEPASKSVYSWSLETPSLTINRTSAARTEVSWPNSRNTIVNVYEGPPSQAEETFQQVNASGRSLGPGSGVLLLGQYGEAHVSALVSDALIQALPSTQWLSGAGGGASSLTGSAPHTTYASVLPDGWVQATLGVSEVVVRGDLRIALWENLVTVSSESGDRSFESGARTDQTAVSVRERNETLLVLTARDARLSLHLASGQARVAGPRVEVDGTLDAIFRAAAGSLRGPAGDIAMAHEPLLVSGDLRLLTWNATSTGRLGGDLGLRDGLYSLPTTGQQGLLATGAPASGPGVPPLVWLLAAVVLVAVAWIARGRRKVSVEDVEWDLLNERFRRGHRRARRLVAQRPRDPDAVFLYGSSLLTVAGPRELVQRIEPLALGLAPAARRGVAYILAVASKSMGDPRRARRWAQEAAAEPALRAQMRKDGLWKSEPVGGQAAGYA